MMWHVTLLFVHAAALVAVVVLYRHSPDRMQRVVLVLLAAAQLAFMWVYGSALAGDWVPWMWKRLAHEIEHIAVLLYVFRLFVVDQERRCLPSSLLQSRSSRPS